MIQSLLQPEVQQFIRDHENEDPYALSLRFSEIAGVPIASIAHQIRARQIATKKLPEWRATNNLVWPAKISMEQCSSQLTAEYKASLVSGESFADLTGGAGVDTYYFAKRFKYGVYVEQNSDLAHVTAFNHQQLGVLNISHYQQMANQWLEDHTRLFEFIYIDPARRDKNQRKVHGLADCEPDVITLLPLLLQRGKELMIKTSPMLDISQSIKELGRVFEVHVVSLNNECKEVLYRLSNNRNSSDPNIIAINLKEGLLPEVFQCHQSKEEKESVTYGHPETYLYEPNASVLKAGCFKSVGTTFALKKLHPNTHLYTSDQFVESFPGRKFKVKNVLNYSKKEVLKLLPNKKANITTRNFPEDAKQVRKKLKLKEGGDIYLFACTLPDGKKAILNTSKL